MFFAVISAPEKQEITLNVLVEGKHGSQDLEVPVTPETTCAHVVSLGQGFNLGKQLCLFLLWRNQEFPIKESELLYDVLKHWNEEDINVQFVLKEVSQDSSAVFYNVGNKGPGHSSNYSQQHEHQQQQQKQQQQQQQQNQREKTGFFNQVPVNGLDNDDVDDDLDDLDFAPPPPCWPTQANGWNPELEFPGRRRGGDDVHDRGGNGSGGLPGGIDLTLSELQEMAARQQQQIEHQQQVLVAKEQRLKYLKQQEARHQQLASETDRLKKLREKVETQEMKLKKLRALRGEAEKYKVNNGGLNSELESVRALFSEKEKELVMAVAKVDELTRQLEDVQLQKSKVKNGDSQSAAALELDKLRKELLRRNKLNEQQNSKLKAHKEMLNQRKDEIGKMDKRIQELQQRLKKKRALQAQQAKQKELANQKPDSGTALASQKQDNRQRPNKSNVAAVEPYIQNVNTHDEITSEFDKRDPKYQSLPVNTKFSEDVRKSAKEASVPREQNNNIPTPVDSRLDKVSPSSDKREVTDSQRKERPGQPPPLPPSSTAAPPPSSSQNKPHKIPPPLPARANTTGLTYLTARPFGSTYSTGAIGRGQVPLAAPPGGPSIQIQEDVRTGGSGQSSPASSDSSMKEVPVSAQNSQYGGPMGVAMANGMPAIPAGSSSSSQQHSGSKTGEGHFQYPLSNRTINQNDKAIASKPDRNLHPSGVVAGSQGNGNLSPNGMGGHSNGSEPTCSVEPNGAKQNQGIRYATKNVIANTYMGRLGPEAMQKYQQSISKLYTVHSEEEKSGSQTKDVIDSSHPVSNNTPTSDSSFPPSALSTNSSNKTGFHHAGFSSNVPHNYTDIASDKASQSSLTRHTPRNLRRRHSDSSDNEDIAKLLHKYVDRFNSKNSEKTTIGGYNTQATSFKDQIPENVPVDDMGNLVDEGKQKADAESPVSPNPSASPSSVQLSPSSIPPPKKKSNLKAKDALKSGNRVTFDPLALLLDASLEGELELVKKCAYQVKNVSEPNDEGITALHNAICAGHYEIVTFLVEFGCDVNSPDSDGWTPLHCAASCNNLPMVRFLVEHGACIFATTISDHETAAEKCEEDEDGFDGCSEYLYSIQEKLGTMNEGKVWAVFDYHAQNSDELSFKIGDEMTVLRKGDDLEKEWWWTRKQDKEGYVPRNLLGLHARVLPRERQGPINEQRDS